MQLLFVADGRSPIALNWIHYFIQAGHNVHLISSAPASPLSGLSSFHVLPLALSGLHVQKIPTAPDEPNKISTHAGLSWLRHGPMGRLAMDLRYILSSFDVNRHARTARKIIAHINPDLVHAMRIPFEGIIAAMAIDKTPLLTSIWGNDLTLFARRYYTIGRLTRLTLKRTSALHCDCRRDLALAPTWDFDVGKPSIVLPGAGGIRRRVFRPDPPDRELLSTLHIPEGGDVVINPRGFRAYIRNDTFFRAIPLVLKQRPGVFFLCSAMQGNPVANRWVERLGIRAAVRLLPMIPQDEMARQFRLAQISLSLSEHDGTPNTLLEAIACGCFPIAGDIETVREWIIDGDNGLLCDSANPVSVANAIVRALTSPGLRDSAQKKNFRLVAERADYQRCMTAAAQFYDQVVKSRRD